MDERCLVIIPTYNEVLNITLLVRSIIKVDPRVDVLVVDDSSPDGTAQVIMTEFLSDRRVKLIVRKKKLGMGSAYIDGFLWAIEQGYKFVMEMDADFGHKPEYIPIFLSIIQTSDLVLGSRYLKGSAIPSWTMWRKFLYRIGSLYAKLMLGIPVSDLTSGFKCFRTEIFKELDLDKIHSNGYAFQIEMTYLFFLLGKTIREIPIIFDDRRVGHSKLAKEEILKALGLIPKLRLSNKKHPALKNS